MKDRPILLSGPMVRATLADEKTQTRRVVKPVRGFEHNNICRPDMAADAHAVWWHGDYERVGCHQVCPYGVGGDRLWVRETWEFVGTDMNKWGRTHQLQTGVVRYSADAAERRVETDWRNVEPWMKRRAGVRPSIHMPRWASRLTLELTAVRVERLQDITEDDARAEGVNHNPDAPAATTCRTSYARLWDSLNAKRGYGWATNPYVWVLEFKRAES